MSYLQFIRIETQPGLLIRNGFKKGYSLNYGPGHFLISKIMKSAVDHRDQLVNKIRNSTLWICKISKLHSSPIGVVPKEKGG